VVAIDALRELNEKGHLICARDERRDRTSGDLMNDRSGSIFAPKLLTTLRGYTRVQLIADLRAGVVGIVPLPSRPTADCIQRSWPV
jgi:hypothetical protein